MPPASPSPCPSGCRGPKISELGWPHPGLRRGAGGSLRGSAGSPRSLADPAARLRPAAVRGPPPPAAVQARAGLASPSRRSTSARTRYRQAGRSPSGRARRASPPASPRPTRLPRPACPRRGEWRGRRAAPAQAGGFSAADTARMLLLIGHDRCRSWTARRPPATHPRRHPCRNPTRRDALPPDESPARLTTWRSSTGA
jgi:hypothetical protein